MARKVKILYTVPNFNTAGSGRVTFKIASNINRDVFEPEICCLHNRGPLFEKVSQSPIPVHIFPYFSQEKNIFSILASIRKAGLFFKKNQFDIIHSMNYMSEYTEAISARMAGIPWVYSKNNMSWGRKRWKIRTLLSSAVFAQNTRMINQFYRGNKKVHWVTDGVDLKEFLKAPAKPEILHELKLQKTRNLITVANLVPIKKIETLIDAFSKLARQFNLCKLIIVGADDNEYAEQLKNQALQLNLSHRIIFTGKKLNVIDYLNAADIFILPTAALGEGSPVALMEAMAANLYSIGSNVPGIEDQLTGLPSHLFNPNKVNDLVEKLKYALSLNQGEFDADVAHQYKIVTSKFDLKKEIRVLEQTYLKILKTQV